MPAHVVDVGERFAQKEGGPSIPGDDVQQRRRGTHRLVVPAGDDRNQLSLQLGLKREHLFTQEWLLKNAGRVQGLA